MAVQPLVPSLKTVPSISTTVQFSAMKDGAAVLYAQIFHSFEVWGPSGSPLDGALVSISLLELSDGTVVLHPTNNR